MSMAEERVPRVAVVKPVIQAIDALRADQANAVRAAIRAIGIEPAEPVDLPTAPVGYPYQAQRPHLATAPLVIYRKSRPGEQGDYLVVSLMAPGEFRQQKQDEQSQALKNPDVRRDIAIAAGTAATTAIAHPGTVTVTPPQTGGAAPTSSPGAPRGW